MTQIEVLGLLAGACTTIAFIPQVVKTYKSKSAKDLSAGMFLTFWVGIVLWLIYGLVVNDFPIIVANLLTFILAIVILFLKVKYRRE